MRRLVITILMRQYLPLLSLCLIPSLAQAQTTPEKAVPLESRNEAQALVQQLLRQGKIMSPSQAKRGMKGYALSVFQGTKVERFELEVLGVLERVQGGGDLVMIKVTSGPVVTRQSGIIQGMSGSPVYINGKLLGAIAIGFGFPKEPIGGVTPITQMIATALPDNGPKVPAERVASLPTATEIYKPKAPLTIGNRRIAKLEVTRDRDQALFSGPNHAATMRMQPTTQFMQMSGISDSSLPRWRALFEPYGITPVLGGGAMMGPRQVFGPASKKTGVNANLAPGAAIGVQLASGDIDMTGIGTVTYRLGNRVLAFGHPMFGLGAVSMPMTTAYVHDIFPAYDISFKLGSPIKSVGELQQDTNFAIGGTVGRQAETVPLRISVRDSAKKINKKFNVRLIKDPAFTPMLAQNVAVEALTSTLGLDSDKTVRIAFAMGLKNGPAIHRVNTVYAPEQVMNSALMEMLDALSITQANQYEKGNITSLDLNVEVIQGRKTARIRRVYADRNRVKAGEKVQVSVEMEPTGEPDKTFTRRFTVDVPADAPSGPLRIAASSAGDIFAARSRVGGAPPRPGNFRELLQAYSEIGSENELLIQTSTPRRFLLVDRKKVSNPPPTWSRLVPAAASTSIGTFNETQEQREKTDWVLSGMESVTIPVESNRDSDRKRPDAPVADDGNTPTVTASIELPDSSSESLDDALDETDGIFVSRIPKTAELAGKPDFARRAEPLLRVLMAQTPSPVRPVPAPARPRTATPVNPTPGTPATGTAAPATTPTPAPTPTAEAGAANIARPAGRWIQRTSADFARGTFDGTLVENDGTIRVGPKNERVVSSAEPVAWSIAANGQGTLYLGTGHSARLLKIENGVSRVIYEGPEVAVSALALDNSGNLYAGVSPGGRVLRFRPDGSYQTILQTPQIFIHALAFDASGNLIVATGGESGAIYRLSAADAAGRAMADPAAKPLATLPQKHARSLAVSGDAVYVGTAEDAILYRVDAQGKVTALYQATGTNNSATSAAPAPAENPGGATQTIIIGGGGATNPNTAMILNSNGLLPGGGGAGASGIEILALAAAGNDLYFGTSNSGSIYRWNQATGVQELFKTPGRAIYALEMVGDALYAGIGETGEVWRVSNLTGEVVGARVLDTNQPQVLALTSAGTQVFAATGNNAAAYEIGGNGGNGFTSNVFDAGQIVRFGTLRALATGANFEFRSGNTLEPDETWSPWKVVENGASPDAAGARYAQYRVKLGEGGSVSRVEVAFRAPNRTPRVAWTSPAGAEFFSGRKTLTWSGADPDKDPLRYKLELIGADDKVQAVQLTTPTATTQEIDTKKYPDGVYRVRISGSDAARNPEDPRGDTATSLPFTIDNTAPTLDTPIAKKEGDIWTLNFRGSDVTSPLAGAEWRIVGATVTEAKPGDWQAAASTDGLFDAKTETGVARLDPTVAPTMFKSGDTIEVRLRDAAGNASTVRVVLP